MTFKGLKDIIITSPHLLLVGVWLVISLLFEFQKIVFYEPLSVHQGAQTDRASIALNYHRVNMNFFEPRVMETGTKDGVTPCEFPIINYTVAILYNLFGFNNFWYRFIMWILTGLGVWAVFDILRRWLGKIVPALVLTVIWYSGSILGFYTANFIPDTAAMTFVILAIRQWYLSLENPGIKFSVWFFVFAALAGLIKITAFIFIIAIVLVSMVQLYKKRTGKGFVLAGIGSAVIIAAWYYYCKWLEKQVGGSYFLMSMATPASLSELKEWFLIYYNNWFFQTYTLMQWLLILGGLISLVFLNIRAEIKLFVAVSLAGIGLFYILMAGQFRYHDYYSITLLPIALFPLGAAYQAMIKYRPNVAMAVLLIIGIWGLVDAKNGVRLRFTPGNYMYQTFFEPKDFKEMELWLIKNGIQKEDKVFAAFDPNPNNLLYFLQRRGYRTFDHPVTYVHEKIEQTKATLINDTTRFFVMYPETRSKLELKDTFNNWLIYLPK